MRLPGVGATVSVRWEDPNCDHEERSADDVPDLFTKIVVTYGRVVRVTDRHITVASEELFAASDQSYRCTTIIPVAIVEAIAILVPTIE